MRRWDTESKGIMVTTAQERHEVQCLLEPWRDIFVTNIRDVPCTDLIEHRILTYQYIIPRVAKPVLYTADEVAWQKKNIPLLFLRDHNSQKDLLPKSEGIYIN